MNLKNMKDIMKAVEEMELNREAQETRMVLALGEQNRRDTLRQVRTVRNVQKALAYIFFFLGIAIIVFAWFKLNHDVWQPAIEKEMAYQELYGFRESPEGWMPIVGAAIGAFLIYELHRGCSYLYNGLDGSLERYARKLGGARHDRL